jgi:hypothetical protein
MPIAQLTRATCEVIGRIKNGQYGDYRPVLFKLPDGTDQWKSYKPNDEVFRWLKKGETYTALMGNDGKLTIAAPEPPEPEDNTAAGSDWQTASPVPHKTTAQRKAEIEEYALKMAGLYSTCYAAAAVKLPPDVSEETLRCAASSLFISCQKKFNLTD